MPGSVWGLPRVGTMERLMKKRRLWWKDMGELRAEVGIGDEGARKVTREEYPPDQLWDPGLGELSSDWHLGNMAELQWIWVGFRGLHRASECCSLVQGLWVVASQDCHKACLPRCLPEWGSDGENNLPQDHGGF